MEKIFTNDGAKDYCIAEVEKGKTYKISVKANSNIKFKYVITDDEHKETYFAGNVLDKRMAFANFSHKLTVEKTGHLCIRNLSYDSKSWTTLNVIVEEM